MKKKVEKVEKKGLKLGGGSPQLTKNQKEVLYLIADNFLTLKQVSIRRQTSIQAVYKIRESLIKKGFLDRFNKRVEKKGGCLKPFNHKIRLHNEQYNIKIIWSDERYKERLKKGNTKFMIDGNTIMLYKENIQIYSNTSFFGDSPTEADAKASKYWTRQINNLQSETKTILLKERSQNINRVRGEYAEVGNELATQCLREHDKIRVIGEDGKVWLLVDNSFNFNELETIHPTQSHEDMENIVQPFFQDLRQNKPPTLSEIMHAVGEIVKQNKETSAGLNSMVQLIQAQAQTLNDKQSEKIKKIPNYIG